jgi:hypothetical protein
LDASPPEGLAVEHLSVFVFVSVTNEQSEMLGPTPPFNTTGLPLIVSLESPVKATLPLWPQSIVLLVVSTFAIA